MEVQSDWASGCADWEAALEDQTSDRLTLRLKQNFSVEKGQNVLFPDEKRNRLRVVGNSCHKSFRFKK